MKNLSLSALAFLLASCGITPAKTTGSLSDDRNDGAPNPQNRLAGNLWIETEASAFSSGIHAGTVVVDSGNGAIILQARDGAYALHGSYTSKVFSVAEFTDLILSWNADTPKNTSLKIEGQVHVAGNWSPWLSWGTWATFSERSSRSSSDESASISVDTLSPKEPADGFRYRVTLETTDSKISPRLNLVAATIRNGRSPIAKSSSDILREDPTRIRRRIVEMPAYSQMTRDPQFAERICSATSMTMLLNRKGEKLIPEQSAMSIYDLGSDSTGNWPFNAAFAGSFGYESYIEYMNSTDDLKKELIKNGPFAVSVQYRKDETVGNAYPIVRNAPIPSTPGHIIVVVGFEKGEDGEDAIVVHDPAGASDGEVRRSYLAREFDAAWATSGRVAYIVRDKIAGDGAAAPRVEQATLSATGATRTENGVTIAEYQVLADGFTVDLSRNPDTASQAGVSIMHSHNGGAWRYLLPSAEKSIWLDTTLPGTYRLQIFKKNGESYAGTLEK